MPDFTYVYGLENPCFPSLILLQDINIYHPIPFPFKKWTYRFLDAP